MNFRKAAFSLSQNNHIGARQSRSGQVPPNPWEVFPEVDAEGLGSLQGNLEHWWQYCWWPYWQSLTPEQRNEWLHDPAHPEAWREYVQLQDAFAGNDTESPA